MSSSVLQLLQAIQKPAAARLCSHQQLHGLPPLHQLLAPMSWRLPLLSPATSPHPQLGAHVQNQCSHQQHQCRSYASLSAQQVQQLKRDLSRPPHSLQYDGRPPVIPSQLHDSMLGRVMLNLLLFHNNKNQLIVGGQALYHAIREQVDDGALQKAFGMDPSVFYSTYTLLAVHVWLVINRLGAKNDREGKFYKQRFYNHFIADVERRVYEAGVQVGVSKWMKKLEAVFYSSGLSFDRALRKESAESLESVVLREFFGSDASKKLPADLIAAYLRHQLQCLQLTDEAAVMEGRIQFSREPFAAFRATAAAAAYTGQQKQEDSPTRPTG